MKHILQSFFFILISVLILNSSSGQVTHQIKLKIDPATGNLIPPADPQVRIGDKVIWVIDDANIQSFSIRRKNSHDRNIFSTDPERPQSPRLEVVVNYRPFWFTFNWKYNIDWVHIDGTSKRFDPKIAVKPGVKLTEIILFLGFITTTILSVIFYRKWKRLALANSTKKQRII